MRSSSRRMTALGRIAEAVTGGGGKGRLLGKVAEALAAGLGGISLVSVKPPGASRARTVLARGAAGHALEVSPRQPGPLRCPSWPRVERFVAGDLGRVLGSLPGEVTASLGGRRRGALGLVPLRRAGRLCGLVLVYRVLPRFGARERGLVRTAGRHMAQALELRDTVTRAHRALAARDQFLALVSHELGGPLAVASLLTSAVEMAVERNQGSLDAQTRAVLHTSRHQLERASTLVRQLAEAARRSGGLPPPRRSRVDLAAVVEQAVAGLRVREPAAHTLRLDLCQPHPRGHWDPTQLEQVVNNLITNALKFGAGRPVEVSVANVPGGAELRVKDHGIGIQPADQLRIFGRFVRAAPPRQYPGLGLGLWLVREIVAAHGGRVSLHSEPGQGAEFVVWLPARSSSPDSR